MEKVQLQSKIIELLNTIYDPEIPVDIYNLGLIYGIEVQEQKIKIEMTLTSPGCPSAQELPLQVKQTLEQLPGYTIEVDLTWDPPWDYSRMTEDARLALDMFDIGVPYHGISFMDDTNLDEFDFDSPNPYQKSK